MMRKIIISSVSFAIILQMMSAPFVSAASVGEQQTFTGRAIQTTGGTSFDDDTNTTSTPSTSTTYCDAWDRVESPYQTYNRWNTSNYKLGNNDPLAPSNTSNWANAYKNGVFAKPTTYRIPTNVLNNTLNDWYNAFTSSPNSKYQYTLMNNNNLYKPQMDKYLNNIGQSKFKIGNTGYNNIEDMYRAANEDQRKIIRNLVKKVMEKTGSYSNTEITQAINTLENSVTDPSSNVATGLITGVLSALNKNGGNAQQAQTTWEQKHGVPTTINPKPYSTLNVDQATVNPSYKTYNPSNVSDNSVDKKFSTNVVKGGVIDQNYVLDRINKAKSTVLSYVNMGADTVDVTKILDYRITSLKVGTTDTTVSTGNYLWTVEKLDSDGKYTQLSMTGANELLPFITYSFRPTSTGHYRITCYPEYTTTIDNIVTACATEYSFLSDTHELIMLEQFFDGTGHQKISEKDTSTSTKLWQYGINENPTDRSTSQYYKNDYATVWQIDVTEDMVDQNVDLNGQRSYDPDTERLE